MKTFNYFLELASKAALIKKIDSLEISKSGIDAEGDPYVTLKDGTTFFGSKLPNPAPRYIFFFHLLSQRTKRTLCKECLIVAMDIVIRYVEQGLKYGGPKKQSRYTVKLGDKVSEMGGYQGFCSIKLAQQVGSEGRVIAIEPMQDNFRLLEKNRKANDLPQLITINSGVWNKTEDLTFSRKIGDGQSSSIDMKYDSGQSFEIKADSLDNIYRSIGVYPDDFMIIQLNGAEPKALEGLTLFKPKNICVAARYDTDSDDAALSIKHLLEARGYTVEIEDSDFVYATL